jgi:hypothetical protein
VKPLLYLCHAALKLFILQLQGFASVNPAIFNGGMAVERVRRQ